MKEEKVKEKYQMKILLELKAMGYGGEPEEEVPAVSAAN